MERYALTAYYEIEIGFADLVDALVWLRLRFTKIIFMSKYFLAKTRAVDRI